MLTKVFNCPDCKKPMDCNARRRRRGRSTPRPVVPGCTCAASPDTPKERGLMDFLGQGAFKKTVAGYKYTLPINDPKCCACRRDIKISEGAVSGQCGHYLCYTCRSLLRSGSILLCTVCRVKMEHLFQAGIMFPSIDKKLAAFFEEIKDSVKEYEAQALRERGAQKCGQCGIEQPVERLFNCNDCDKINCGNCFFDSHQGHDVVKLLGVELDQIEKRHVKIYTETLEGLHGNLQYVQKNIDKALEKVVKAGQDRLSKIKECDKYEHAKRIVKKVQNATGAFEKHCEVYFPVARELATRLEVLGEELMKEEE